MTHPALRDLLHSPHRHPAFQELLHRLLAAGTGEFVLSGLAATAQALYLVLLRLALERPLVVVVDSARKAEVLAELITTFHEALVPRRDAPRPQLLPAWDVLPGSNLSPHSEVAEQRAVALYRLAGGLASITVLPMAAALLRLENADYYGQLSLHLRIGDEVSLEMLTAHLGSIGYEHREPVEMVGQYSVRGGIIDVFPAEAGHPVRLELFGDVVESMRAFDVATQRSTLKIEECSILPLVECPRSPELLRELAAQVPREVAPIPGEAFPGWEFLAPLIRPRETTVLELAANPVVVLDEPGQLRSAAARLWARLDEPGRHSLIEPRQNFFTWEEWESRLAGAPRVCLLELDLAAEGTPTGAPLRIASRPSLAFHGNMPVAVAEARNLVQQGYRVVFFAASTGEVERLADIFSEYSMPFQLGLDPAAGPPAYLAGHSYLAGELAGVLLAKGMVRRGTVLPDSQLAIFGGEDLFDTSELISRPALRASQMGAFAADLGDLKPGDYAVHATHGIGRFLGVRELTQGDQTGDFMLLEYAGEAKLYVPLARMDLVEKYRGAGDAEPGLDRLGGVTWSRTKSRVKARMRDMAEELLKLYAERKLAEGFGFSADSNWQREFEDAFEFTETRDQLTAIAEIKRDMENPQAMDRLLCGDVGFGKTEVAMRAAFKVLGDGRQVAVLAPTTVLSFQHFETFRQRFAPFPVRVEMISRFRSARELKAVLEDLAAGKVDIAIGTHRLLSADVRFADLGLLVIDEEQRFGVRHKERLKQLRKNVDVLTMTATPIPRTLHMALVGLRDLSVIETPPKDRLSIQTVVAHFRPELVRTAIEQELARGGQVYYLHNRVDSIWNRAATLQEMLPECRLGVAHGQMGEAELEKVMLGFMRHQFDVLVCTTIVENGLDIPLANTIIVENAERYGLSELYQLRGRVGRSNRRAYAFLLVPADTELTELARKRLAALREFSDLGAGFKIAALDLELRGAGNLLGGEQHGHINAVGYDMYMSLLEQTVRELRGEEIPLEVHSTVNLGLDLRIGPDYIADEHQRLRAYKRIAEARDREQAGRVLEELEDRYGPAPGPVRYLLRYAVLKSLAERLGIESIDRRHGMLNVKFHAESKVNLNRLTDLVRTSSGAQFTPAGVLRLPAPPDGGPAALLESLEQRLLQLLA